MKWPFVTSRTHRQMQQRCDDAIESTIYWRQCHNDLAVVCHARDVAIGAMMRAARLSETDLEMVCVVLKYNAAAGMDEVHKIAIDELRRHASAT